MKRFRCHRRDLLLASLQQIAGHNTALAEHFIPFELCAKLAVYYMLIISVLAWFSAYVEQKLA